MPIFRHFARETVRATVILFFLRDEARICLNLSDQGLAFPVPDFRILLARFELPGADRGAPGAPYVAGNPLARDLWPRAWRKGNGRETNR